MKIQIEEEEKKMQSKPSPQQIAESGCARLREALEDRSSRSNPNWQYLVRGRGVDSVLYIDSGRGIDHGRCIDSVLYINYGRGVDSVCYINSFLYIDRGRITTRTR